MFQKAIYAVAYAVRTNNCTAYIMCDAVCGLTAYASAYAVGGHICCSYAAAYAVGRRRLCNIF